jgi:hypothetical protein
MYYSFAILVRVQLRFFGPGGEEHPQDPSGSMRCPLPVCKGLWRGRRQAMGIARRLNSNAAHWFISGDLPCICLPLPRCLVSFCFMKASRRRCETLKRQTHDSILISSFVTLHRMSFFLRWAYKRGLEQGVDCDAH